MTDIYKQHEAAFAQVSAYVILKDGERVATVAFKFPRTGAGRLWAYVHWIGLEMVRGHAGGYGYDKRTAAVSVAARKMGDVRGPDSVPSDHYDLILERARLRKDAENYNAFRETISADRGPTWDSALRDAGFTVLQAV